MFQTSEYTAPERCRADALPMQAYCLAIVRCEMGLPQKRVAAFVLNNADHLTGAEQEVLTQFIHHGMESPLPPRWLKQIVWSHREELGV